MKHKVKVTVLDKKLYPELQRQYCADANAGPCPCYHVGDEFVFLRDDQRDDFWHMGINTLIKTAGDANTVAGAKAAVLLGSVGRDRPVYLYRITGGLYYEGVDEGGKYHDRLLLGRNAACGIQNRAHRL